MLSGSGTSKSLIASCKTLWGSTQTIPTWFFAAAQVTVVPAYDATGFVDDPQLQARGVLIGMEDAELASPPVHAIYPATGFLAAAAALKRVYKDLLQHGLFGPAAERLLSFEAMHSSIGFDEVWQRDRKLSTPVNRSSVNENKE